MTAAQIVLWRHGQTEFNATHRWQGQLDVPLDEVGYAQVEFAAVELAATGPVRLVSSDLKRAIATAEALARCTGLDIEQDLALREVDAGDWEGLNRAEIIERWPGDFAAWRGGEDIAIGGGERRSEVGRRAAGAIERHAAATPDDGLLVVVSHGMALRMGLLNLLGLPMQHVAVLGSLANSHWAWVERGRTGWSLHRYNVGPPGGGSGAEG